MEFFVIPNTSAPPHKSLSASRHLVFNTFSLKSSDGTMRHPTTAESDLIIALFPTTYSIGFLPPVLVIRCTKLPPKPWPVTIAGVPAWFTSDESTYPIPLGMVGLKGNALADHVLPLWKTPTTSEFSKVIEALNHDFGVEPLSVLWTGTRFLITIPIGTNCHNLPGLIMGLLATYKYPDTNHPTEAALRWTEPSFGIRDETNYYPNLRPGVMLSCGTAGGKEQLTTSGIPVKDKDGKMYITVASHGFPLGEEQVWHPTGQHRIIGEVKAILGNTDISLMELNAGLTYSTETFGSSTSNGITLTGFLGPDDIRQGQLAYLDNPFSGRCDGMVSLVERQRIPIDEPVPLLKWITVVWVYIGNGAEEPLDGSYGSAVWDEGGRVIALFRFADENGWARATSVMPLVEAELEICPVD
jgi:hypothetical protein